MAVGNKDLLEGLEDILLGLDLVQSDDLGVLNVDPQLLALDLHLVDEEVHIGLVGVLLWVLRVDHEPLREHEVLSDFRLDVEEPGVGLDVGEGAEDGDVGRRDLEAVNGGHVADLDVPLLLLELLVDVVLVDHELVDTLLGGDLGEAGDLLHDLLVIAEVVSEPGELAELRHEEHLLLDALALWRATLEVGDEKRLVGVLDINFIPFLIILEERNFSPVGLYDGHGFGRSFEVNIVNLVGTMVAVLSDDRESDVIVAQLVFGAAEVVDGLEGVAHPKDTTEVVDQELGPRLRRERVGVETGPELKAVLLEVVGVLEVVVEELLGSADLHHLELAHHFL